MANTNFTCAECIGLDRCNKYCAVRLGENIVKYVNNLDSIETSIGEFKTDKITKKKTLVVSGFEMENHASPINILTSIDNMQMSLQSKLSDFMGITPLQMVNAYTEYKQVSKAVQIKAVDDLKKFCSNKILPTPIKPGMQVEIIVDNGDGDKRISTTIYMIRWLIDKPTGELIGYIVANTKEQYTEPYKTLLMRDYGKTWFLPNIERNVKSLELSREAIKISNIGIIHPIKITDDTTTIALDGINMYINYNGTNFVAGSWQNGELVENKEYVSKISSTKAYKKLKSIENYVEKHKRFIAPYGLLEPNTIKV